MGGRGSSGRSRRAGTDAEMAHEIHPDITPQPARSSDDTRTAVVNGRWERALHQELTALIRQPGDWVALADLRAALATRGLSREAQDAHLKRLSREGKVHIVPESNRKTLVDRDHAAAIRIGGEDNHLVMWQPDYQPPEAQS